MVSRRDFPRVYPILDTGTLARVGVDPVLAAAAMLDSGVRILQFRHKAFWSREIYAQGERIADLCSKNSALCIVNDRADYASFLQTGLHLGQEDLTPEDARKVTGPNAILGFSTHNAAQMRAAAKEPVDYVAFGPVFPTASKQNPDPTVGVERLREIRGLTERPLVAIGGITMASATACWDAGADSVAVITGLLPDPCSAAAICARCKEWLSLEIQTR